MDDPDASDDPAEPAAGTASTPADDKVELPAAKVLRDKRKPRDEAAEHADAAPVPTTKPAGSLSVELEASRQRSISWTLIGGVLGALLIWKLGTVGVWGGFVLVAIAVYHAWNLIQTFLYPPGTIIVTDRDVTLPRGLSMPRPITVARAEVTAVYFLRRSVPWNHAAPVLVIELGPKAMAFPRDWFASEADQRHVIHALLRDKKLTATAVSDEPAA